MRETLLHYKLSTSFRGHLGRHKPMQTKHATYIPFFALPVTLAQSLPTNWVDTIAFTMPFIAIFTISLLFTFHLLQSATKTLDVHVEQQLQRQKLLAELPHYSISRMRSVCKAYNIPIVRTYTKSKLFDLLSQAI